MDYRKVSCDSCRQTAINEQIDPECLRGSCPIGFDELPPEALRMLEIKALLDSLGQVGLADRICEEFSVDVDDLRWLIELAELDALNRVPDQPKGDDNG